MTAPHLQLPWSSMLTYLLAFCRRVAEAMS